MKKWRQADGTVSVFLISIIAGIFVFNAVLIDYARIYAAKQHVQAAHDEAIRSILAAFDSTLQSKYGLFGFEESQVEGLYPEMVANNLPDGSSDAFRLTDPRPVDDSVQLLYPFQLGSHTIFRQQILEDMKYKAPVELTLEVLGNFQQVSEVMQQTSALSKAAAAIEKDYEDMDNDLNTLWDEFRAEIGKEMQRMTDESGNIRSIGIGYPAIRTEIIAIQELEKNRDALREDVADLQDQIRAILSQPAMSEGAAAAVAAAVQSISQQINRLNTQISEITSEINKRIPAVNDFLKDAHRSINKVSSAAQKAESLADEALKTLERTQTANNRMRTAIEKAEREAGSSYEQVGNASVERRSDRNANASELNQAVNELAQTMNDMKDLILPDSYFSAIRLQLTEERNLIRRASSDATLLSGTLPSAYSSSQPPSASTIRGYANNIAEALVLLEPLERNSQHTTNDEQVIRQVEKDRRQRRTDYDNPQHNEIKDKEEENALSSIADFMDIVEAIRESTEAHAQVDAFYRSYMALQNEVDDSAYEHEEFTKDVGDTGEQSMGQMDQLFEGIADLMLSVRDELYVNEYAMARFKSFEVPPNFFQSFNQDTEALKGNMAQLLDIGNSEVEYIIYGLSAPGANIAAAYGEIFLLRLAINTLEGYLKFRGLGHPLLIAIAALAWGITNAVLDVIQLMNGKAIQFMDKFRFEMNYRDHLRLFLLLHSNETKKMSRMQALIQNTTGQELSTVRTYAEGQSEFTVRLWFLPGVMDLIGRTGISGGEVEGNRYRFSTRPTAMSY